jgi:hypothetical protein
MHELGCLHASSDPGRCFWHHQLLAPSNELTFKDLVRVLHVATASRVLVTDHPSCFCGNNKFRDYKCVGQNYAPV